MQLALADSIDVSILYYTILYYTILYRDCWPIYDKKQEQDFRKTCVSWLGDIAKVHTHTHTHTHTHSLNTYSIRRTLTPGCLGCVPLSSSPLGVSVTQIWVCVTVSMVTGDKYYLFLYKLSKHVLLREDLRRADQSRCSHTLLFTDHVISFRWNVSEQFPDQWDWRYCG